MHRDGTKRTGRFIAVFYYAGTAGHWSGYGIKFVYKDSNTVEIQEYNNPGWPAGGKTNGIVIGAYANSSLSSSTKLGTWDMFQDLTTMTRK